MASTRQRRIPNIEIAAIDHEMDEEEEQIAADFSEIHECTRIALAVKSLIGNAKLLSNLHSLRKPQLPRLGKITQESRKSEK